ncbi:N-lysine methyltransferase SETD8-A, partial [Austrofundulus limnaeus]|uniref:N-lysine methyltransferase SETD8-A n=1 Tax=Austrofundulus limnaeus TaxID=52670 RepID=A0A2I4ALK7_AUSLI
MQRRRRINPKEDAKYYIDKRKDKDGLDIKYINAFKGRGIFANRSFVKGDFLLEYRGELISKDECERRQRVYHNRLKVFLFEFYFNGKLWCVDGAKEDGSLGRLVNDDHINPNAKMKYLTLQGKPHLCLFAICDINPGEEVTYNYGDSNWPWRSKQDLDEDQSHSTSLVTHLPAAPGDVEQMIDETQSQAAAERQNQTDLVPGYIEKNAKQDLDEDQSPSTSLVTHLPAAPGDVEQMIDETQSQAAAERQNQTDLVPGYIEKNAK